jgi:hypothetical protein
LHGSLPPFPSVPFRFATEHFDLNRRRRFFPTSSSSLCLSSSEANMFISTLLIRSCVPQFLQLSSRGTFILKRSRPSARCACHDSPLCLNLERPFFATHFYLPRCLPLKAVSTFSSLYLSIYLKLLSGTTLARCNCPGPAFLNRCASRHFWGCPLRSDSLLAVAKATLSLLVLW